MSDVAAVVLAVAVWIGALVAAPVPRWAGALVVVAAFAVRRPAVLVVGGLLLASSLSAASWAGLVPPQPASVRGDAILLSDPEVVAHATRVDVRIGGRRVEAWARGVAADALRDRLAGEVVPIEGRLRGASTAQLAVAHIAARLDVASVGAWRRGSVATRAANWVRRVLLRGSSSMRADRRALLSGFLLGDDRDIDAPVEADFRASGLTHLLAVSGQNLAFALMVFAPVLRRLGLRGRLVLSLSVIAFFAVLTRAEPSVLRASAMASIACWSAFSGRPVSRIRVLALAVAALVLIDPMLARSVGFQLSVGASMGLALLAAPIAARLPGPGWLADSLGVTLAAQAGVAPVLLTTFGGMPVVTPLANLLAVPVAGPLTAWGLGAGFVAGVLGAPFASWLHLPTTWMVAWIAGVARWCARLPFGLVDARHLALAALVVAPGIRYRRVVVPALVAATVVVAWPTSTAVAGDEVARGAHLWRGGGTVLVVDGAVDGARVLDGLRRAGVRRIDLLVATHGSKDVAGAIVELRARVGVRSIAAPPGNRIRDATTIAEPCDVHIGDLDVRLVPKGSTLQVVF